MTIISKTTFTVTVLHRTDDAPCDVWAAVAKVVDGHMAGAQTDAETVPLPVENVPTDLAKLGNDPRFFDFDIHLASQRGGLVSSFEATVRLQYPTVEGDPFGPPREDLTAIAVAGRPRRFELREFSFYLPLAPGDVVVTDDHGHVTALDTPVPGWLIRVTCHDDDTAEIAFAEWARAVPADYNGLRQVTLLSTSEEWIDTEVAARPDWTMSIDVLRRPGQRFSVQHAVERWAELP